MDEELEQVDEDYGNCKHRVMTLETEMAQVRKALQEAQSQSDELPYLRLELSLLQQYRRREVAKKKSATQNAATNVSQLQVELTKAQSQARQATLQLKAAHADAQSATEPSQFGSRPGSIYQHGTR